MLETKGLAIEYKVSHKLFMMEYKNSFIAYKIRTFLCGLLALDTIIFTIILNSNFN